MENTRLGLGTDQLWLPENTALRLPPALPPPQRAAEGSLAQLPPLSDEDIEGLAPWAWMMLLPGWDT